MCIRDRDDKGGEVLVKEYLPSNLAVRTEAGAPPKIAPADLKRFRYGMKCFFEEGRALAKLQHPNVVRVLNFFRANDTVYLVMRYERGFSLQHLSLIHISEPTRLLSISYAVFC